ncbi:MAG: acyl-CoA dehydrogenase [Alphaproteobacteria bacterium]|nr:acyl-CoA dehydrogenase [Alphaproteobacteria bacterium]
MDFSFSEDQRSLVQGARAYFSGRYGPEVLRRLDLDGLCNPEIWKGLTEMGLTGLLVPSEQGGMGMGLVEGALIAAECGRVALAEPLVDTALIAVPWLISRGDTEALAKIAAGEKRVAISHVINPWLNDGDGTPLESIDPLRHLTTVEDAENDPFLLDLGALMSAAQLIGVGDAMLSQAVEYAKIRTQFGQPIGAFQAIKHQLANCVGAIEFAKPVVWRAAQAMQDALPLAPVHVSHAKFAATDAATLTAETAIQVHGAMGYTYEVDLHFWMKRCWALAGAWGDRAFHLRRIDHAVLGGEGNKWPLAIGPEHTFS